MSKLLLRFPRAAMLAICLLAGVTSSVRAQADLSAVLVPLDPIQLSADNPNLTANAGLKDTPMKAELRAIAAGPFVEGWQQKVGARTEPKPTRRFLVDDFGAKADGVTISTGAIQRAIDAAAEAGGGAVEFSPGSYVTGSLFLKSHVNLNVAKGVTLLGAETDAEWPLIFTRAAGIETYWRAALLNVRNAEDVSITGEGVVNARGKYWWDKFRSAQGRYQKNGLRWAVDYDVPRPHLVQLYESKDVTFRGLTLQNSPFWTFDVVYCRNVTVEHVTIRNNLQGKGPSTDGINLDSSAFCVVQHCDADTNDDNYSYKAGMNADGQRVNLPAQYCIFRHLVSRLGAGGIVYGSDMSGGIRHVEAHDIEMIGTTEGLRFKSSRIRGGVVEDVLCRDIRMSKVPVAIAAPLNWFPAFSYPKIPEGATNIPPVWRVLAQPVPPEIGVPLFRDITIRDVVATGSYFGIKVEAHKERPMENVRMERVRVEAKIAGSVRFAKDWTLTDTKITGADGKPVVLKDCEGVDFGR